MDFDDETETPNVSVIEDSAPTPMSKYISSSQYYEYLNDPDGLKKALSLIEGKFNQTNEELDLSRAQIEQQEFDKGIFTFFLKLLHRSYV
jgi:hypothetical protein